jgi:hypothetical protein
MERATETIRKLDLSVPYEADDQVTEEEGKESFEKRQAIRRLKKH